MVKISKAANGNLYVERRPTLCNSVESLDLNIKVQSRTKCDPKLGDWCLKFIGSFGHIERFQKDQLRI